MAKRIEKMMKVDFPDGKSESHPLPPRFLPEKLNEQMMSIAKRGILFPKAVGFSVVEIEIEEPEPVVQEAEPQLSDNVDEVDTKET